MFIILRNTSQTILYSQSPTLWFVCSCECLGSRYCLARKDAPLCGWSTLHNSCVEDGFTRQDEFEAGYGCPNETDCNADCGSVVNGYAKTADRRLRRSLTYKIGSRYTVDSAADCAVKCTALSDCRSFETRQRKSILRCLLRREHPRNVGLTYEIKEGYNIYEACSDC